MSKKLLHDIQRSLRLRADALDVAAATLEAEGRNIPALAERKAAQALRSEITRLRDEWPELMSRHVRPQKPVEHRGARERSLRERVDSLSRANAALRRKIDGMETAK